MNSYRHAWRVQTNRATPRRMTQVHKKGTLHIWFRTRIYLRRGAAVVLQSLTLPVALLKSSLSLPRAIKFSKEMILKVDK